MIFRHIFSFLEVRVSTSYATPIQCFAVQPTWETRPQFGWKVWTESEWVCTRWDQILAPAPEGCKKLWCPRNSGQGVNKKLNLQKKNFPAKGLLFFQCLQSYILPPIFQKHVHCTGWASEIKELFLMEKSIHKDLFERNYWARMKCLLEKPVRRVFKCFIFTPFRSPNTVCSLTFFMKISRLTQGPKPVTIKDKNLFKWVNGIRIGLWASRKAKRGREKNPVQMLCFW